GGRRPIAFFLVVLGALAVGGLRLGLLLLALLLALLRLVVVVGLLDLLDLLGRLGLLVGGRIGGHPLEPLLVVGRRDRVRVHHLVGALFGGIADRAHRLGDLAGGRRHVDGADRHESRGHARWREERGLGRLVGRERIVAFDVDRLRRLA